ncbi:MAG: bifunctional DNA-formamidopyrimidine glycosylase/DNA-(apurinic or apyrimidinic site) lyase [Pseudomonadota bacterium]
MPELPEVETVRRQLSDRLKGRIVAHIVYHRPNVRILLPTDLPDALAGRMFGEIARHGKYMIATFADTDMAMGIHLGMSGHFLHYAPGDATPAGRHDHMEITLTDGTRVLYHDPRRFGMIFATIRNDWRSHKLLSGLGPDPITDGLDAAHLHHVMRNSARPIKPLLLDQTLIAGIGNIYASEALYVAGISPFRPAKTLTRADWDALVSAIITVLNRAISLNGSTYRDYRVLDGGVGRYQEEFKVYDKAGHTCPGCEGGCVIQRVVQAGRATYYCAVKQK